MKILKIPKLAKMIKKSKKGNTFKPLFIKSFN